MGIHAGCSAGRRLVAGGCAQSPYSQACENNKHVILEHLRGVFADRTEVLELGGGTGQHATWFAQHLSWLRWQPTDIPANLAILERGCAAYEGDNLSPPLALDVTDDPWALAPPHALFSANSLHIMPYAAVEALFRTLGILAEHDTCLVVYGPFNYAGQYTSPSNARFDQWLASQNAESAIRDFEKVDALAISAGFKLERDEEMPANNRLLVWRKAA